MFKLRELRLAGNLTLREVAEIIGTSNQVVSRWELEQTQPPFDAVIRIANYFKVSIDFLLGHEKSPDDMAGLSEKEKLWLKLHRILGANTIKMICTAAKGFAPEAAELLDKIIA